MCGIGVRNSVALDTIYLVVYLPTLQEYKPDKEYKYL